MFSSDQFDRLIKVVMARLGIEEKDDSSGYNCGCKKKINLTASQALVVIAILAGVFEVDSVLVDKSQQIQIVLTGSLKRKTQLDKVMDQIGQMPFDDVINAIISRGL